MQHKLRIMKTRPEIPDEEIRSYMDFDQLIRNHDELKVRRNKFNFLNKILVISFAIVTSSLVLYYYNTNNATEESHHSQDNTTTIQPSVDPQNSNSLLEPNEHQPSVSSTDNVEVKSGDNENKIASPKQEDIPIVEERLSPAEAQPEYTFVEAEPINGYPHLYDYFNRELKYPAEALGDSIQGMVTVSVVINETGQPEKTEIRNSLGEPFDREVRRVIENMPPWKPASVNGKPVSSKIAIPLTFQVKKIKNSERK